MSEVIEYFLRYVKIDTQSKEGGGSTPTTPGQRELAELLAAQLKDMGAEEVTYDREHCYVYATVPAAQGFESAPVLGFIAHMDTSPAVTGKNVNPRIVERYDGGDIVLDGEGRTVLKPEDFPSLLDYVGRDLIVTDGTTLLGADDKAGVAEIMAMARYFLSHPEASRGKIRIGFTPDEEVGAGADYFDLETFGAAYAYTVDGGKIGELEYENFNAAGAKVTFRGRSVHPGDAKGKMRNAVLLQQEFHSMLPCQENPMYTEGYEGFYHLDGVRGCVEEAVSDYIIRDHDREKFERKKEYFMRAARYMDEKYGSGTVSVRMEDTYYNMADIIRRNIHLIDIAGEAMEELGITPVTRPIRGGTDGARLSYMGLPCPNLGTGGHNCHGKYEYACVQSMERNVELLVKIAGKYARA